MPRKPLPWFRFYCETVTDPKLRRIPPEQRWVWPAVLTIARESPTPGHLLIDEGMPANIEDIADKAAVPVKVARAALDYFLSVPGFLVKVDGVLIAPNFTERQYESDSSTNRTRKHRSKERVRNVPTSEDGTEASSVGTDPRGSEVDSDANASSSDDDDPIFTEALRRLADRKMTDQLANGRKIPNRPAWRTETMRRDRDEFQSARDAQPDLDVDGLLRAFEAGPAEFELAANREIDAARTNRNRLLALRQMAVETGNTEDVEQIDRELEEAS